MMRMVKMKATGEYRVTHLGVYKGSARQVDDRWLFESRKLHLDAARRLRQSRKPNTKETSCMGRRDRCAQAVAQPNMTSPSCSVCGMAVGGGRRVQVQLAALEQPPGHRP